jgi:AAA+ superfamily predicted ATPase
MIGMDNIKESIFNKIILHLQNLDNKNTDFNHIVLCGAPGMGKTHVAKILGKIYTKMGFLSKGDFKEAKITDLKAGYIGQTEIKTQKLLDESKGCVLFFDEAYSLGGDNKFDSYSQSIIDVINPYLDKYKDDFILIVAGYKNDLEQRFFKGNQGLKSRFGLWLEINEYKPNELNMIFKKKIEDYGWKFIDEDIKDRVFIDNKDSFKFFGRDIENLFSKCKLAHAKRVLFTLPEEKKIINKDDLNKGLEMYLKETQGDLQERREIERIRQSLYL